jgi:hypothetical protein
MVLDGSGNAVDSLEMLVAVFAAVALPLTLAVVRTAVQQRLLGIAVLVYMGGYCVGMLLPHLGTALGAWLGPAYTFVPIVLAAAIGLDSLSAHAPADPPVRVRQGDLVTAALFVIGIGIEVLAVQHLAAPDTQAAVGLAWLAVGLLALVCCVWWQNRLPEPALDLSRLRQRWFLAALFSGAVVAFGLQFAWRAALLLVVGLIGTATVQEMVVLTLVALLGAGVGVGVSALMSSRMNGGHLMAAGIMAMGVGMLGVAGVFRLGSAVMWLAPMLALVGGGLVLANTLRTLVIVAGVSERSVGTASGLLDGVGYFGGMLAGLIVAPLVAAVTLPAFEATLLAEGASAEAVAAATASMKQALAVTLGASLGVVPTSAQVAVGPAFIGAVQAGLVVLSLLTGLALVGAAAVIWVAWRGRDTPLWPPPPMPEVAPPSHALAAAPAPAPPPASAVAGPGPGLSADR